MHQSYNTKRHNRWLNGESVTKYVEEVWLQKNHSEETKQEKQRSECRIKMINIKVDKSLSVQ